MARNRGSIITAYLKGNRRKRVKRTRYKTYDEEVIRGLKKVWVIMGFICGKRLKPAPKEIIPTFLYQPLPTGDEIGGKDQSVSSNLSR